MEIRSPAFFIGNTIPFKYTCDGENISPPLHWEAPPQGTKSFALILLTVHHIVADGWASCDRIEL